MSTGQGTCSDGSLLISKVSVCWCFGETSDDWPSTETPQCHGQKELEMNWSKTNQTHNDSSQRFTFRSSGSFSTSAGSRSWPCWRVGSEIPAKMGEECNLASPKTFQNHPRVYERASSKICVTSAACLTWLNDAQCMPCMPCTVCHCIPPGPWATGYAWYIVIYHDNIWQWCSFFSILCFIWKCRSTFQRSLTWASSLAFSASKCEDVI